MYNFSFSNLSGMGGGISIPFSPSDLNPLLWLKSSDVNASILDSTDVVSLLDKSEELAETNVYTSDFSTGVNGWGNARLTLTGNKDNITDDFSTTKNNCLRGILNSGSNSHRFRKLAVLTIGKTYEIAVTALIPSGQNVDGYQIYDTSVLLQDNQEVNGIWTTDNIRFVATSTELRISLQDGSSGIIDGDGEVAYIGEVIINEIQGNHFIQTTSVNRPVIDNTTNPTKVTFTASNSEYLENTLDIASFTALSQGSIIGTPTPNGTGNIWYLSFQNPSSAADYFRTGTNSSDKATLTVRKSSGTNNLLNSTSIVADTDVIEWKLINGAKKCFINGIEDAVIVISGSNGSEWIDYPTSLGGAAIGAVYDTPPTSFYDVIMKELIITSTPLTDAQSLNLANYLQNQVAEGIAQDVINKFPNALADGEEVKIRAIVKQMYNTGVWQQHDYFFGWFLTDEANALISWKGTKTATNVNSATFNEFGVLTDGSTSYINTNIVPSTDLTNASLNNAHVEGYCYDNLDVTSSRYLYGSGGGNFLAIRQSAAIAAYVNGISLSSSGVSSLFMGKTRYGIGRIDGTNQEIFVNGTEVDTESDSSTGLGTGFMSIGGISGSSLLNARQSYFCIGGGYDLTALNASLNLVQSLFNLD
jgi:hypothetical protein